MNSTVFGTSQTIDLLYQALETEKGGVQIYTTALRCALNKELREEWNEYLAQTKEHVQVVSEILQALGKPLDVETPGRKIVRHIGDSLVQAMEMALRGTDLSAAQLVATECVTLAETKDHLNWQLLGQLAGHVTLESVADVLEEARTRVEPQENEHLYHTQGWARELWMQNLGLAAMLPPPEETNHVKS